MNVILISGKAEAGKSTTASFLKENLERCYGVNAIAIVPYGDYVKSTARLVYGWDGKKDEAGRELLQNWGTNVVRNIQPDFWIETVRRLAEVLDYFVEYLIVDDCRFPNEISAWSDYPHCHIRVERPHHENALTDEQRQHISETALDDAICDFRISAENYEALYLDAASLTEDVITYFESEKQLHWNELVPDELLVEDDDGRL